MFNSYINYKWPFSIAMLNYQRVSVFVPHRSQKIPREDPTIGLGFLRRSHEILIPSVPLAGWDVAFAAQARLDRRREMEMFSNDINV